LENLAFSPKIDNCCAQAVLDFPNLLGRQQPLVDQFKDLIIDLINAPA
jgi:hypothetical protein